MKLSGQLFGRWTGVGRLTAIAAGLAASVAAARAAVVLSDDFTYPNGALILNSAFRWNTHSGATGQTQVAAGRVLLSQNQTEDVSAGLTNAPFATGTLYARFVVNFSELPSGAGNYFAHFKGGGTEFRAKVFATTSGAAVGRFRVGLANVANTPATIPSDLVLNSNYTLVVRYTVNPPSGTLWINPANEAATARRVDATDVAAAANLSAFALRQSNSGGGMGVLALDDLVVAMSFEEAVPVPDAPPVIQEQPQDQTVPERATATFSVTASGAPAPGYQWQWLGADLPGATNRVLTLPNVTVANAGVYAVRVTNVAGSITSAPATLTVLPLSPAAFRIVTYNTHGGMVQDWSTNSPQVQAIGRQLQYLQPDIVTFQEIPFTNTWQMADFVRVWLPGYALATNSGTDGFIRSVIASRWPISRSQKWLDGVSLAGFGYDGSFTRDLFEAQIAVPQFPQPLHVFTAHLKAGQDADSSARRAAEANAISNFFVTGFLTTNALRPWLLTGDLNEDLARPPASLPRTVERLISPPTGLFLTTPTNPVTGSEMTFSIQADSLTKRYDYILPCGLLFSNVVLAQVFRSDLLTNPPPPLRSDDSRTASDHLPVVMAFSNPYTKPFRLTAGRCGGAALTLRWETVPGQPYDMEVSTNQTNWETLASHLLATSYSFSLTVQPAGSPRFFRVRRSP